MSALDAGGDGAGENQRPRSEARPNGSQNCLAVCQAVGDRAGGSSDVDQGDGAFELVVTGLVEEIADGDDSRGFSDEVHGQARPWSVQRCEPAVQFLSSALQIGAGHREVGASQRGSRGEQYAILRSQNLCSGYRSMG